MTSLQEHVAKALADAPPLTSDQKARIRRLLGAEDRNDWKDIQPRQALDRTPPPVRKCALYRQFDADGVLLYVGISVNPDLRRKQHGKHSAFVEFAATETVVWYLTDEEAKAAEKQAIKDEAPLFNKTYASPERDQRLVKYLADRGALHLLKVA